jgi:DNA-binding winged helix-turn-helix (wHTH) protein/class 3 adenylate cyclase/tetratricopeptide (TPR) repeat protein
LVSGPQRRLYLGPTGLARRGRGHRSQGASGARAMVYRFGDCSLDTQRHRLQRAGQPVRLRSKVFQVLRYLLEHRDRTVLKQELCEQVWPQQFISEATLESTVRAVRQAIGDSGRMQQLIQTVYGYGYRFSATVEEGVDPSGGTAGEAMRAHPDVAPVALMPDSVDEPDDAPATDARAEAGLAPQPEPPRHRDTAPAGEWKVVTVLCCALAKVPVGSAPPEPEAWSRQMRALYVLARDAVQRHGGILRPVMGESIIAVFGAPTAQEDHAQRAVLAGLELQRRLRDAQHEVLEVRMGLHTALVTVGGVGDDPATTVAVVGDAVTRAAALQKQAARGVILCSEATARLVQQVVRVAAVVPVPMAGEVPPVPAYTVFGRRGRRRPLIRRGEMWVRTPFLGRPHELATLRALWQQAQEGRGQVMGVVGEPGIGKSRLVYEYRRSLGGRSVTYLTSSCRSHGAATPYLPILDLLRQTCGITERDDPRTITAKVHASLPEVDLVPGPWAPYLLRLLEVPAGADLLATLSPQAVKARTTEAFVQLALQGARQRPLVLEVENLHWIDPSSEEVLVALVERLVAARILLLLTYRPGYWPRWIDRSYATQLALMRLGPRDSRRLVQAIIRTVAVPDGVVQAILAQAEGNPLFLEELAQAAVELGDRPRTMVLPTTIQSVLAARIDRLPPEEKQLLQVAAVIGRDIAVPLLEAVAEVPAAVLQRSLAHLQAMELLYEATHVANRIVTFKHALTWEAAYRSLLASTRQEYHQRIAQVLEARFPESADIQPELLAHHCTEAGFYAQAISYWQQAGQRAFERSANLEAIGHFTKALELLKTLPDARERTQQELTLLTALGVPMLLTKGHAAPEVGTIYTRARKLCRQVGETPQLFSALLGLWRFSFVRGEFQTARELEERLLSLAESRQDPALLLRAHLTRGEGLLCRGAFAQARAHAEQGIALYDPQQHRMQVFRYGSDSGGCVADAVQPWLCGGWAIRSRPSRGAAKH